MKKWRVSIEVSYEVEAENEDMAETKAKDWIVDDLYNLECTIEEIEGDGKPSS